MNISWSKQKGKQIKVSNIGQAVGTWKATIVETNKKRSKSQSMDNVLATLNAKGRVPENHTPGQSVLGDIKHENFEGEPVATRIVSLNSQSEIEIGILGADLPQYRNDVLNGLKETKRFSGITSIDTSRVTPTLKELDVFDSVIIWSNYKFADENKLGDVVAAYADTGKGVVTCLFENLNNWSGSKKYQLGGKWLSQKYGIYEGSSKILRNPIKMGKALIPNHPLLKNMKSFSAQKQSCRMPAKTFSGAKEVLKWSDNLSLIAIKESPETLLD